MELYQKKVWKETNGSHLSLEVDEQNCYTEERFKVEMEKEISFEVTELLLPLVGQDAFLPHETSPSTDETGPFQGKFRLYDLISALMCNYEYETARLSDKYAFDIEFFEGVNSLPRLIAKKYHKLKRFVLLSFYFSSNPNTYYEKSRAQPVVMSLPTNMEDSFPTANSPLSAKPIYKCLTKPTAQNSPKPIAQSNNPKAKKRCRRKKTCVLGFLGIGVVSFLNHYGSLWNDLHLNVAHKNISSKPEIDSDSDTSQYLWVAFKSLLIILLAFTLYNLCIRGSFRGSHSVLNWNEKGKEKEESQMDRLQEGKVNTKTVTSTISTISTTANSKTPVSTIKVRARKPSIFSSFLPKINPPREKKNKSEVKLIPKLRMQ